MRSGNFLADIGWHGGELVRRDPFLLRSNRIRRGLVATLSFRKCVQSGRRPAVGQQLSAGQLHFIFRVPNKY